MTNSAFLCGREHPTIPRSQHNLVDAVFVDRDGTLNQLLPGYRTVEDFLMLPGAAEAIARLNSLTVPVILVTNQQGLGTGALSWAEVEAVHVLMTERLGEAGAHLDDIRLCPHRDGTCECRKPKPGLLREALRDYPWIRPERSLFIGDSLTDAQAASRAGVMFRRVGSAMPLARVISETFG